ncbi:histidinol-phosphate transaminase [Tumebacillus flagellatus]|uniref:Histidinol-phosphate aminotransferase n=1 Tax=Tumebacillus flagellatus TaxID=1157490 RepID=A0A074LVK5_9BACL|nr:histidinol-phosphate transaminase [Tumebacillus flagellatus]KEO85044.1 histidinol-phosphate aminotransferase [Tumebacillus flagellatus]
MSQEILNNVRKNLQAITPYAPGKPISDVKREYGLEDVIKLASNENPAGPSPKAQEAIAAALWSLHRYPDGGAVDLKAALAATYHIPTGQILVGNGSDECIKMVSETFLNPGDEVVVPVPSFSQYWFGTQVMDGTLVQVPLADGFEYDLDAMLTAVTERTKLLYLCTPNNPTGTYLRKAELRNFLDKVPSHVLVILDEAYAEYVCAEDAANGIDFLREGYNVLVMRTFSKMYALAALRIGYVLCREDVVHEINRVREPFNVNTLAQVAAVAALGDAEHVEKNRAMNQAGYEQVTAGLTALGFSYIPTQANFLLFDTKLNDKELFQLLLEQGVITRSGTALGAPGYLRVTIGTKEENQRFLTALELVVSQLRQKV